MVLAPPKFKVNVVATNKSNKERMRKKEKTSAITLVALPFENDINKVVIRYIPIGMKGKNFNPNPFNISFE